MYNRAFLFNIIFMKDYRNVKRWQDLSDEDKLEYYKKFNIVINYLKENKNITLPWEKIDNYIGHIYRFSIDDWNASHYDPTSKLVFDDVGLKYSCWGNYEV